MTVNFVVTNLNFIFKPSIEIEIAEKQFFALKKFCWFLIFHALPRIHCIWTDNKVIKYKNSSVFYDTVEPWNNPTSNSHTYPNSHTLSGLTKMWLFGGSTVCDPASVGVKIFEIC